MQTVATPSNKSPLAMPALQAEAAVAQPSPWLLAKWSDIAFLHVGIALLAVPVVVLANWFPDLWPSLFWTWTLLFSVPHQSATIWRLATEQRLKMQFPILYLAGPVALLVATLLLVISGFSSQLATVWLFGQIWHVSAQNFGIMRKYARVSAAPRGLAAILAEFLNFSFPIVAFVHCLQNSAQQLFWYPLSIPAGQLIGTANHIAELACLLALVLYVFVESNQWRRGISIGKRPMILGSILGVHFLACYLITNITWAYLAVSLWHSAQYLAFSEHHRRNITSGRNSFLTFLLGILAISCIVRLTFSIADLFSATVLAALQFSFAFHHYWCDSLIWKSRRS